MSFAELVAAKAAGQSDVSGMSFKDMCYQTSITKKAVSIAAYKAVGILK